MTEVVIWYLMACCLALAAACVLFQGWHVLAWCRNVYQWTLVVEFSMLWMHMGHDRFGRDQCPVVPGFVRKGTSSGHFHVKIRKWGCMHA